MASKVAVSKRYCGASDPDSVSGGILFGARWFFDGFLRTTGDTDRCSRSSPFPKEVANDL